MKKFFKTINVFIILFLIFFNILFAFNVKAEELFDTTLVDIQKQLDGNGVKLIDFKEEKWGSLNKNIATKLMNNGIMSLSDIENAILNLKKDVNKNNIIDYLNSFNPQNTNDELSNDELEMIANTIINKGENQINIIGLQVIKVVKNLIGSLAILWIVIAGIQIFLASGDEEKIKTQKNAILYAIIGLIIMIVLEGVIYGVYGGSGVVNSITAHSGIGISPTIDKLIYFLKSLIASLAIFMIILSGIKLITAQGNEESEKQQKTSIKWIIIGLIVIIINKVIIDNLYVNSIENNDKIAISSINNVIAFVGKWIQFGLGFVGIIAFLILIYGGINMIINYGDDDAISNSKNIIKNAIIGIIIIISSFAIVSTVIF